MQAKKSTENSWKIRDSERKMKVNLVKESDNEADKEAIKVELPGFGITAISPEDGTYYIHIPLYS